MWQGDFTFELTWRAGWWRSIMYGGMPEAEATFRGQLIIIRMKGRPKIFECCTQCMLYSVYAVLGVNSWSCQGEIERDELTLCSAMMVEMWMRKREMGDEDENNVEDTSGYEKSGVRLAWLGWEDLVSVLLHARSGLMPAVSGMVNWLAHEVLLSPSFSWWFVPSPLPSPKHTKFSHPSLSLHAMIKSQPGSRSVGWGWEDMVLPGREDPRNCIDPRNRRKSEWDQKIGKIECVFRLDWQSEKKRQNGDQRAICYATRGIDPGGGVIRPRGVSDGSDGARPLWRSHPARTEMFFADESGSHSELHLLHAASWFICRYVCHRLSGCTFCHCRSTIVASSPCAIAAVSLQMWRTHFTVPHSCTSGAIIWGGCCCDSGTVICSITILVPQNANRICLWDVHYRHWIFVTKDHQGWIQITFRIIFGIETGASRCILQYLWIVLAIVLCWTILPTVHRVSAYLCLIVTS